MIRFFYLKYSKLYPSRYAGHFGLVSCNSLCGHQGGTKTVLSGGKGQERVWVCVFPGRPGRSGSTWTAHLHWRPGNCSSRLDTHTHTQETHTHKFHLLTTCFLAAGQPGDPGFDGLPGPVGDAGDPGAAGLPGRRGSDSFVTGKTHTHTWCQQHISLIQNT